MLMWNAYFRTIRISSKCYVHVLSTENNFCWVHPVDNNKKSEERKMNRKIQKKHVNIIYSVEWKGSFQLKLWTWLSFDALKLKKKTLFNALCDLRFGLTRYL